jgi:hypothetical protein
VGAWGESKGWVLGIAPTDNSGGPDQGTRCSKGTSLGDETNGQIKGMGLRDGT